MLTRPSHLLYLHGFRSSPESQKAKQMRAAVKEKHPSVEWWCPQLPPSPAEAAALIERGTAQWNPEQMAVVGSSLGGFYATWVAEKRACKAVLLNPAVDPARDLAKHIGEQRAWHDPTQLFYFRPEYIEELRALEVGSLTHPERFMAIIAKGDEVLDWREMFARYERSQVQLLEGGDHALSDFDRRIDDVLAFLELRV